jgi:hypothetical protein
MYLKFNIIKIAGILICLFNNSFQLHWLNRSRMICECYILKDMEGNGLYEGTILRFDTYATS